LEFRLVEHELGVEGVEASKIGAKLGNGDQEQ